MSDLLWRLANRREMVNCGNGDVRDIPDEDCVEAAAELTRLREQCEAKDAEIERLKAELFAANTNLKSVGKALRRAGEDRASLSAENERLRKALTPFAKVPTNGQYGGPLVSAGIFYEDETEDRAGKYYRLTSACFRIAREALAAHVGEGEKDGLE
jgi:septal ring factor EnvC (AmiA/AmiB activator)